MGRMRPAIWLPVGLVRADVVQRAGLDDGQGTPLRFGGLVGHGRRALQLFS